MSALDESVDARLKASSECFINHHLRAFDLILKEIEEEKYTTAEQVKESLVAHVSIFKKLRIKEGLSE